MQRQALLGLSPLLALLALLACGQMATVTDTADSSPADDAAYAGDFDAGVADAAPGFDPSFDSAPFADDAAAPSAYAPPSFDAGPDGACTQPIQPGNLVIDELMVASVAGSGDYGEWVEISSTLPCALDLRGLHGECPKGAKVITFDITEDLLIPPLGTFLVADSSDPGVNHDLPGPIVVWYGQPGDVLRNQGSTVTLTVNGTIIDSVTYPSVKLVGASMAFPSSCLPSARAGWSNWQPSTASWFPAFFGTPNAPNVDVQCP
jgi:hypothetical protein